MTIEQAMAYQGYSKLPTHWLLNKGETIEEKVIKYAVDSYNWYIDSYHRHVAWVTDKLHQEMKKNNDTVNGVVIEFEDIKDYVGRKDSYGPKFNAWTPNNVYVVGMYDGHEWIVTIPRNPTKKGLNEPIGGG